MNVEPFDRTTSVAVIYPCKTCTAKLRQETGKRRAMAAKRIMRMAFLLVVGLACCVSLIGLDNDKQNRISAQRMLDEAIDFIHAKDGDLPPPYPHKDDPQYPPDWLAKILPRANREELARRRLRDAKAYGMESVPSLQDVIADKPPWAD